MRTQVGTGTGPCSAGLGVSTSLIVSWLTLHFCPQALEFKICRMRPSARSLVCGERWSGGASRRFAGLLRGCALLVKVFSVVHSVLHVDVYRYAGLQGLVHVRDVLIHEGYAELADECYESKVRMSLWGAMWPCARVHQGGIEAEQLERSVPTY